MIPKVRVPEDGDTQANASGKAVCLTLTATTKSMAGEVFVVDRSPTTVGRSRGNKVVINHLSVSAQHAKLVGENGQWRVMDLLSSNGTFVNGNKVSVEQLNDGDQLQFGEASFTVSGHQSALKSSRSYDWLWASLAGIALGLAAAAGLWRFA